MHVQCVELFTGMSLSERARLVHPWPLRASTWRSPPFFTCRTFPADLCFLNFSRHFRLFFPYFFFRFVCVRVLGARHRGRARRRRGCQRVLAGRGGVARSVVAALVARRRVCLDTRGKHECALSGLHLHNSTEYVRVYKGLPGLRGNILAVLIFATGLKITEGAPQSEQQHCRAGERRPR